MYERFLTQNDFPTGNPKNDFESVNKFYEREVRDDYDNRISSCFVEKIIKDITEWVEMAIQDYGITVEDIEEYSKLFTIQKKIKIPKDYKEKKNRFDEEEWLMLKKFTDSGERNKFKRFLEKEPISHLKILLKQAGYKGYEKMNKKEIISLVLNNL